MDSSKFLVALTLMVMMTISYDLFTGIGINARTVPPTCYEGCNTTFYTRECNKMCVGLAYKSGKCMYPPPLDHSLPPLDDGLPPKRPYFPRCCCDPIILAPPSF
ncbi:hypothetical protein CARUB_v10028099mg [Capsella rubella]|uniref:Defensin-like domain-containing protein n=1 Tax=Capsella rubella TaxID=81985 RepID=R0G862_9BRAS|nr:defensin-like protein 69 [Capsella rubella]EOA12719.1 hypothetical protein CARUB_v10028099mg [Capsella rubella]